MAVIAVTPMIIMSVVPAIRAATSVVTMTPVRPATMIIIMRTAIIARRRWTMMRTVIPPATIAPAAAIPVVAAMAPFTVVTAVVIVPPAGITPVIPIPVITATIAVTDID